MCIVLCARCAPLIQLNRMSKIDDIFIQIAALVVDMLFSCAIKSVKDMTTSVDKLSGK